MELHRKIQLAKILVEQANEEMQELRKEISLGNVVDPKFKYQLAQENCDDLETVVRMLDTAEYKAKELAGVEDE